MNFCQSVTGASTAYLSMTIPNHFFRRYAIQFTNWLLFVSQKHCLHSTFPLGDNNFVIPGCSLVCNDHLPKIKCRGACLYYRNYLPLRVRNIGYLKKWLNFENMICDKSCNFVVLYWSSVSR